MCPSKPSRLACLTQTHFGCDDDVLTSVYWEACSRKDCFFQTPAENNAPPSMPPAGIAGRAEKKKKKKRKRKEKKRKKREREREKNVLFSVCLASVLKSGQVC